MKRYAKSRLAGLWVLAAAVLQAQSAVEVFIDEFQRKLGAGDRPAVIAAIRFPVVVALGGIRMRFPDADALVARYDDIFTPELRSAIASARSAVAETPDGITVGANVLSLEMVNGEPKVTAITVPPVDTPATPSPTSPPAHPGEPRRIGLRGGPGPTRFAGSLASGAVDSYVVFVPKGQLIDVRLERVRGEALVRVVNALTGVPLNARTAAGALVVSGRAEVSGDYRIEVRRTSTGDLALPYMLAVSTR